MKVALLVIFLLLLSLTSGAGIRPFWKVFCDGSIQPVYRGRLDTIVNPGKLSGHVHRVFGSNAFNIGDSSRSALDEFKILQKSNCTTCSISTDKTNYWIPDLYYKWPDGTFSVVPSAGLTVYYITRAGSGAQAEPVWNAFPKGLRMLAGNPFRRSYNDNSMADRAISYSCIGSGSSPETNGFPTDISKCTYGFRAQVGFPMCWNGVDLDSTDHKSHMSYPIENYNGGNCPATHPKRIPWIFFEVLYSITKFPQQTTYQPYVWSCGDNTGYGLHGDFLNGWQEGIIEKVLTDSTCDAVSTNNGNNVAACASLAPYIQPQATCDLQYPYPIIEDLGLNHPITALPGCNPVTAGPTDVSPGVCNPPPTAQASVGSNFRRFLLKPKTSALYVSAKNKNVLLTASASGTQLFYSEVWVINKVPTGWTLKSDLIGQFVVAPNADPLICNRGSADTWETFVFAQVGSFYTIKALSNSKYISLTTDGTLRSDSNTVGDKQLWQLIDPNTLQDINVAFIQDDSLASDTTPEPSNFPGWAIGVIVGIMVVALVIILAVVVIKTRKHSEVV